MSGSQEEVWQALFEELAALEHVRWAHWQRYLHDQCRKADDGALIIPARLVERWERQIACRYDEMTEVERESDRQQVQRYFPVIQQFFEEWLKRCGNNLR